MLKRFQLREYKSKDHNNHGNHDNRDNPNNHNNRNNSGIPNGYSGGSFGGGGSSGGGSPGSSPRPSPPPNPKADKPLLDPAPPAERAPDVPDRVDITDADRARFECDCQGCRKQDRRHRRQRQYSFDPGTLVPMADGTTKAIKGVEVGDEVVATDPETGETSAQPVTDLHVNLDRELTTLTLASLSVLGLRTIGEGEGDRSTRGPTEAAVSTLETTQNHPFWDVAADEWVEAGDLVPGRSIVTGPTGERQLVVAVDNYTGAAEMRDLTVANIHTYYVVAGDTPVLVHNNNDDCPRFLRYQELTDPQMEQGGFRYQVHVTGTRTEEVWRHRGRDVHLDGGPTRLFAMKVGGHRDTPSRVMAK